MNWREQIEAKINALNEGDDRDLLIARTIRDLLDVAVAAEGIEREMCRDNPFFPHHQAVLDALDKLREVE